MRNRRIRLIAKGVVMKFSYKYKIPVLIAGMSIASAFGGTSGKTGPTISYKNVPDITVSPDSTIGRNGEQTPADVIEFQPDVAISASARRYDVVYSIANGDEIIRRGGTRAWRNNNPGCIRCGQFARDNGSIGSAGGFAVFPDHQTGRAAITQLLLTDAYINKTIGSAMHSYAPPFENNTAAYKAYVRRLTGLPTDMRIRDLNPAQLEKLVAAICQVEGWQPGTEWRVARDTVAHQISGQSQKTI